MPSDQQPKPPPPESWEHAPRLPALAGPAVPELVSDGGGLPFAPWRLVEAGAPLDASDPAVVALVEQIEHGRRQAQPTRLFRPKAKPAPLPVADLLAGWRELAREEDQALFGRGQPPQLLTVAVRRGRGRRWSPLGASNSRPLRAVRDGVRASSWRLDPSFAVTADARELRILIIEVSMATGTPVAERLLEPELFLDAERALLRLYIRPLEGYVGRTARRESPVVVLLPEPLGNRRPLDGALYEPPQR